MGRKKAEKRNDRSVQSTPLFHYTVGLKMWPILQTGALLPTGFGLLDGERPALWFSQNLVMEPTARKACVDPDGVFRTLTMRETHEMCGGLIRFRLDSKVQTFSLREFKELSGISDAAFRVLVIEGWRQNANPHDWRVSFEPVSLDDIEEIQAWDGAHWTHIGASAQELRDVFLNEVDPERKLA